MSDIQNGETPRMSGRKFIGIWAVVAFVIGVALGTPTPGDLSSMIANKIGHGVPFALIGALIGAAVQFFFRSTKRSE